MTRGCRRFAMFCEITTPTSPLFSSTTLPTGKMPMQRMNCSTRLESKNTPRHL